MRLPLTRLLTILLVFSLLLPEAAPAFTAPVHLRLAAAVSAPFNDQALMTAMDWFRPYLIGRANAPRYRLAAQRREISRRQARRLPRVAGTIKWRGLQIIATMAVSLVFTLYSGISALRSHERALTLEKTSLFQRMTTYKETRDDLDDLQDVVNDYIPAYSSDREEIRNRLASIDNILHSIPNADTELIRGVHGIQSYVDAVKDRAAPDREAHAATKYIKKVHQRAQDLADEARAQFDQSLEGKQHGLAVAAFVAWGVGGLVSLIVFLGSIVGTLIAWREEKTPDDPVVAATAETPPSAPDPIQIAETPQDLFNERLKTDAAVNTLIADRPELPASLRLRLDQLFILTNEWLVKPVPGDGDPERSTYFMRMNALDAAWDTGISSLGYGPGQHLAGAETLNKDDASKLRDLMRPVRQAFYAMRPVHWRNPSDIGRDLKPEDCRILMDFEGYWARAVNKDAPGARVEVFVEDAGRRTLHTRDPHDALDYLFHKGLPMQTSVRVERNGPGFVVTVINPLDAFTDEERRRERLTEGPEGRQPFGAKIGKRGHRGAAFRAVPHMPLGQMVRNVVSGRLYYDLTSNQAERIRQYLKQHPQTLNGQPLRFRFEEVVVNYRMHPQAPRPSYSFGLNLDDPTELLIQSEEKSVVSILYDNLASEIPRGAAANRPYLESRLEVSAKIEKMDAALLRLQEVHPDDFKKLSDFLKVEIRPAHDVLAEEDTHAKNNSYFPHWHHIVVHEYLLQSDLRDALDYILYHEVLHQRFPKKDESAIEQLTLLGRLQAKGTEALNAYPIIAEIYRRFGKTMAAAAFEQAAQDVLAIIDAVTAGKDLTGAELADRIRTFRGEEQGLFTVKSLAQAIQELTGTIALKPSRNQIPYDQAGQRLFRPRKPFGAPISDRSAWPAPMNFVLTDDVRADLEILYRLRSLQKRWAAFKQGQMKEDVEIGEPPEPVIGLGTIVNRWPDSAAGSLRARALAQLKDAQNEPPNLLGFSMDLVDRAIELMESDLQERVKDAWDPFVTDPVTLPYDGRTVTAVSISGRGILGDDGRLYVYDGLVFPGSKQWIQSQITVYNHELMGFEHQRALQNDADPTAPETADLNQARATLERILASLANNEAPFKRVSKNGMLQLLGNLLPQMAPLSPRRLNDQKKSARSEVESAIGHIGRGEIGDGEAALRAALEQLEVRSAKIPGILDGRQLSLRRARARLDKDLLAETDQLIAAVQNALRDKDRATALSLAAGFRDFHFRHPNYPLPERLYKPPKKGDQKRHGFGWDVDKLVGFFESNGKPDAEIFDERFIQTLSHLREPLATLVDGAVPAPKRKGSALGGMYTFILPSLLLGLLAVPQQASLIVGSGLAALVIGGIAAFAVKDRSHRNLSLNFARAA